MNTSKIVVIWSILSVTFAFNGVNAEEFTRVGFVKALNGVSNSMNSADVVRILGKPDDIRTHEDHGGIADDDILEIWRYGTAGHLTFATLAEIAINRNMRVHRIYGQSMPVASGLPPEKELRPALSALGDLSQELWSGNYNPRTVIRAANLLHPLGRRTSIAVVEEFIRLRRERQDDRYAGDIVLRVLFDIPMKPGYLPEVEAWPFLDNPRLREMYPRYPLNVIEDIPFLVGRQVAVGGDLPHPEVNLKYYIERGVFRSKALTPPDNPLRAFEKQIQLLDSGLVKMSKNDLARQLFMLVNTIYRADADPQAQAPINRSLEQRLKDISEARFKWNQRSSQYTFLDGRSLPVPDPSRYRCFTWKIPGGDRQSRLVVEREDRFYVNVVLREFPGNQIRLFVPGSAKTSLCNLAEFDGNGYFAMSVRLNDNSQMQAEVVIDGKKVESPVFIP